jgi:hypothetical protein
VAGGCPSPKILPLCRAGSRLEERLAHHAKPKLPIVGELGCLPFEADAAQLFFRMVSRRYEKGAMLKPVPVARPQLDGASLPRYQFWTLQALFPGASDFSRHGCLDECCF